MSKKQKWFTAIFILVIIGGSFSLYSLSHSAKPAMRPGADTIGGTALQFKVTREDLASTIEIKGKSAYQKETVLYAPFTADITAWKVTDGAQVQKADILFELEEKSLRTEIANQRTLIAKQELENKLKDMQNTAADKATGLAATNENEAMLHFAQAEAKKVQKELDQLSQQQSRDQLATKLELLQKAKFAAPETGIFLFGEKKEPRKIGENEPIGKIVDLSNLQMVCAVGEYDVFQIKAGMPVDLQIDALKQEKLKGKVARVSKFANASADPNSSTSSSQFEVLITLDPHEKLIAGLNLTGTIQISKKNSVLVVPTLAISQEKEEHVVYVSRGQGIERQPIQVGLETAEKTEVLSGLQEGDTLVLK